MERHLLISSDCHAGLPPGGYREYLDPEFRETFDVAHAQQIRQTEHGRPNCLPNARTSAMGFCILTSSKVASQKLG